MNKHFMIAAACIALVGVAPTSAMASELSQLCAVKAGVTPVKFDDAKNKEILSERGKDRLPRSVFFPGRWSLPFEHDSERGSQQGIWPQSFARA